MALPTAFVRTLTAPTLAAPAGAAFDTARQRLFVANAGANNLQWTDPAPAAPVFAGIGMLGTAPNAEGLALPLAVAVESAGHLVVLDAGNGELDHYLYSAASGAYAYDGAFLGGSRKEFAGAALAQPADLELVGGALWVLDPGNGRVVLVDPAAGTSSVAVSDLTWNGPTGLAVDAAGTVFVADTQNHQVLKYAPGAARQVIGGPGTAGGKLKTPRGLLVDGSGQLYVADTGNQRVQVFDTGTGAFVGGVGSAPVLASIRGLALDDAGRLYVTDAAKNAVHVFGPAATGPILRFGAPTREYESVGVGYALDLPIAIHNDGPSTLSVSNVVSSAPAFSPSRTSFTVAPGGETALVVRFSPTSAGFVTGTLTLTSDSTTGATAGILLRGTGITPPLVDAVLVLDRSGSMWSSAGAQSKMAALQRAAELFVDLARGGLGDRLGVVEFDDVAAIAYPLTPVNDVPPSTRTAAKGAITALAPRGATSIGAGIELGRTGLGPVGTSRRVLVVVSDGMENTPPYVKIGGPSDPRVDLALYAGITIYTVGLGLGSEVDLGVLSTLASTSRGSFYLTETRWLTLPKFFVEIFGDTLDEFVTLDPEFELTAAGPVEVEIDLGQVDSTVTFTLYWGDPAVALELEVVAPTGAVLSAGSVTAVPGIRHGKGAAHEFFRAALPLPQAFGRAWDGQWKLRVTGNVPAGQRVPFGLSALVASNLGIECGVQRLNDATGEPIEIEMSLTEYGLPIAPTAVSLTVDRPAHSAGTLRSDMRGRADTDPDYATDAVRDGLAWSVQNDPRFAERIREKVELAVVDSSGSPVLRGAPPNPAFEGSYHYRFVALVERDGLTLRRECAHSFAVVAHPSRRLTKVDAHEDAPATPNRRFTVTIRPVDDVGNLLGPGLGRQIDATCDGGRVGAVHDLGDGTYSFQLTVPEHVDLSKLLVRFTMRDRLLEWSVPELLDPITPRPHRPARPFGDANPID